LGKHAPGKTGLTNFLPAVFNATMAQAEGGRIIRKLVNNAYIGTTFSCSEVIPFTAGEKDVQAANRVDILLNRLFIEPSLGMGYPDDNFGLMDKLHIYCKEWRYKKDFQFDFDFIGIQNYFPLTVRHNKLIPIINAVEVTAKKRKAPHTDMGWEINGDSFDNMIQRFNNYKNIKEIIVTENGACFKDVVVNGVINDTERINYYKEYLQALLRAKHDIKKLRGYFAWTLMDNFEWAEGYTARFGLIHIDFTTQQRTIKNSGYWWRGFLQDNINPAQKYPVLNESVHF
jgi:beta-glucosidase